MTKTRLLALADYLFSSLIAQANYLFSRTESVIYRATVRETVSGKAETYTGLTGREFKERWYEHRTDINNKTKKKTICLSAHTRLLKEKSKNFTIDWRISEKAKPYNPISKK